MYRCGAEVGVVYPSANILVMQLEKWQGAAIKPYTWEEDAWVVAAKQIKARNPKAAVIVWLDSVRIYQQNKTLNPVSNSREGERIPILRTQKYAMVAWSTIYAPHYLTPLPPPLLSAACASQTLRYTQS